MAPKFPRFGRLFSKAVSTSAAHTEHKISSFLDELAVELHTTTDRLRSWQNGVAHSMTFREVEHIARLAVTQGHLPEDWLKEFLNKVELAPDKNNDRVPLAWRKQILDSLRPDFPQVAPRPTAGNLYELVLADGSILSAIGVAEQEDLFETISTLQLKTHRPALVVTGGAAYMNQSDSKKLKLLFEQTLAPLCQAHQVNVVDGATDSGVIRLIGQARDKTQGTFPLIGVACENTIQFPEALPKTETAPLEPNHTHAILVPGNEWKHASIWMSWVAETLAQSQPIVTVLANGGSVTHIDFLNSICRGHPVIVLEGSGRTADDILNAVNESAPDHFLRQCVFPVKLDDAEGFKAAVMRCLKLI